jgi:5-hydroxyisourate hydrolase-like protein (transthyretin family)
MTERSICIATAVFALAASLLSSFARSESPATAAVRTGDVTGLVVDESDKPAADVIVVAQQAGEKMRDTWDTKTDAGGTFTLTALPEGDYNLKFRTRDGKQKATASVIVVDGNTANLKKVKLKAAKAK